MGWHSLPPEEVLKKLNTSEKGLSSEEAKRRLEVYGYNEIVHEKKVSVLAIFLRQFKSFLIGLLIFAMVVSLAIAVYEGAPEEYYDALAIAVIVVLNAAIGTFQEYKAEKALESLKRMLTPTAKVIRDGRTVEIQAREVVPGDVIVLEAGDRVPADARLLRSSSLEVDEAPLTGESIPVEKRADLMLDEDAPLSDRRNMVYMGTTVTRGRAEAVVVATGANTEFGKIAKMIEEAEEKETPLAKKLDRFGKHLGILVIALCLLAGGVQLALHEAELVQAFMTAVALAVSAVPEGLPAVVTITLALGVREMARRNAIVRRLASVETLGCVTVICTDKTGTITKNEMTVKKLYVSGKTYEVTGTGYSPKGEFLLRGERVDLRKEKDLLFLLRVFLLCNHADLFEEGGEWKVSGDPTEGALVVAATKAGLSREELLAEEPMVDEIPFDSARKMMTTLHKTSSGYVAYVKGAPEVLLEKCSYVYENGSARPMARSDKEKVLELAREMGNEALRTLAAAFKLMEEPDLAEAEKELVFVGLAGMMDPPREEVKEAIEKCKRAGIRVVMVTGDHKVTAVAVAKEVGLVEDDDPRVLTGSEVDAMSDEELKKALDEVAVFARVSPEHKVRIAKALKEKGHVVAMTGDGVNDAPALKTADVGVAMGIKGTEVTKEASDLVLADDNFATIVKAVERGRAIYDNIRKFIRYMLSSNFDEIAVILASALMGWPLPLLPMQILWINLITDGLPATSLSVDPPEEDVMDRPPRDPKEGILARMEVFIGAYAVTQFLATMLSFYIVYFVMGKPYEVAVTTAFTQAVLFELFVVWNCRSETRPFYKVGFASNMYLLASFLASLVLQIAVVYAKPFQLLLETAPLSAEEWAIALAFGMLGWLLLPNKLIKSEHKSKK